jgi:hypothetical protein
MLTILLDDPRSGLFFLQGVQARRWQICDMVEAKITPVNVTGRIAFVIPCTLEGDTGSILIQKATSWYTRNSPSFFITV